MTCASCESLRRRVRQLEGQALRVSKALRLPEGTVVVSPNGARGVVGPSGMIRPETVTNVVGQPEPRPSLWRRVNLNDPNQVVSPGALPNSSAPLAPGVPSKSVRVNLRGRSGHIDDLIPPGWSEE